MRNNDFCGFPAIEPSAKFSPCQKIFIYIPCNSFLWIRIFVVASKNGRGSYFRFSFLKLISILFQAKVALMVCTKPIIYFWAPAITTKSIFFYYFWGDRISSRGLKLNVQDIVIAKGIN